MEPRSPSKTKLPDTVVFHNSRSSKAVKISITLLALALLVPVGAYLKFTSVFASNGSYFTVVLDAGSSGTRVNVYEWIQSQGDLPVLLHTYPSGFRKGGCNYHCLQTVPGLDKFVGNSSGIRASLEPLINLAESWVPKERHGETPIFVFATAGLRRLDVQVTNQVLEDVGVVLEEHGFVHRKSWIRVLSGREEAYYGWVGLNLYMGSFANSTRLPTLGRLDLGGSSFQVAAEIKGLIKCRDILKSKIGVLENQIVAHSFPHFGLTEAFDRTVVMLGRAKAPRELGNGILGIVHPCLGSSFRKNYTCYGCFGTNPTSANSSDSQMTKKEPASVFLVGEPHWDKCKALARAAAVNSSSADWNRNCSSSSPISGQNTFDLSQITAPTTRFHALSGFFAAYSVLNSDPKANLTQIWNEGKNFCLRAWDSLPNLSVTHSQAEQYCFRIPYMLSLIENALCLGNREIIFGPADVSWTLGAALVEGKYLWSSGMETGYHLTLGFDRLLFSPFSLFVLLACVTFVVYRSRIKLPLLRRKPGSVGLALPSFVDLKCRPV